MDPFWIKDSIKDIEVGEIYDVGMEIGRSPFQVEGALSIVSACYDRKTKQSYAVNIMKKKVGYFPDKSSIKIFIKLDQRNVMKVKEVFETYSYINVVREYIIGKSLFETFKEDGPYTESKVGSFINQILDGLRYLHEFDIIHGNLRSENILVIKDLDGSALVKICDHIQSTIMHYDLYRLAVIAIPSLCAPEIMLSQLRTKALDMWNVGLITFILLFGDEPFYHSNDVEMFRRLIHCQYEFPEFPVVTSAGRDFIRHLLVLQPIGRISVIDAIQHPWHGIHSMKNLLLLDDTFKNFLQTIEAIDIRLQDKVMSDIRRSRELFENLVNKMPYKQY